MTRDRILFLAKGAAAALKAIRTSITHCPTLYPHPALDIYFLRPPLLLPHPPSRPRFSPLGVLVLVYAF